VCKTNPIEKCKQIHMILAKNPQQNESKSADFSAYANKLANL
jgi:hypothetical protein